MAVAVAGGKRPPAGKPCTPACSLGKNFLGEKSAASSSSAQLIGCQRLRRQPVNAGIPARNLQQRDRYLCPDSPRQINLDIRLPAA